MSATIMTLPKVVLMGMELLVVAKKGRGVVEG
jgi:hypothetical protein